MTLHFTGKSIVAFGRMIPATCVVRNDLNGWRRPNQVLREKDGRIQPDGTPYQPRPFPPGRWQVTEVVDKITTSVYWPTFIRTNAWQWLEYWSVDERGHYDKPTGERFKGYGYAAHHARVRSAGALVRSNTTLGCINILEDKDSVWLGDAIRNVMGERGRVYINVLPFDEWEA